MGNPGKEPSTSPAVLRRCRAGLLLLCFGLFLASSSGTFLGNQDTIFMWGVARELSRTGSLAAAPELLSLQPGNFDHLKGEDGRHYFPKGMSYSLALAPFCWLGDALALLAGAPDDPVQRARYGMLGASAAGPLFAALEVLLIFELCRLAWGLRLAALAALGAGLGTLLWSNSKSGFSEPFMGLLLTFQLYCLARYRRDPSPRWPALLGTAFALLFLSQPAMAALAGPPLSGLVVWTAWRTHRLGPAGLARAGLAFGLPVAAGLAVFGWINVLRYGEVTETGYWSFVGTYIPLYEGVYGALFSPGKSLFLYSPVLALAVFGLRPWLRRIGPAALFPVVLLLLFLGLYGALPTWHGDGAWGPRYFSPLTGSLAVLAAGFLAPPAARRRELAWIALVALGAVVQVIGVTTSTPGYFGLLIGEGVMASNGDTSDPSWKPVLFEPRLSPVAGRARLLASRVRTWISGEGGTWTTCLADGTRATVKLSGYDALDLWPARGRAEVSPGLRKAMVAAWLGLLAMAGAGGLVLRSGLRAAARAGEGGGSSPRGGGGLALGGGQEGGGEAAGDSPVQRRRSGEDSVCRGASAGRSGKDSTSPGEVSGRSGRSSGSRGAEAVPSGTDSGSRGAASGGAGRVPEGRGGSAARPGGRTGSPGASARRRGTASIRPGELSGDPGMGAGRQGEAAGSRGEGAGRRGEATGRRGVVAARSVRGSECRRRRSQGEG